MTVSEDHGNLLKNKRARMAEQVDAGDLKWETGNFQKFHNPNNLLISELKVGQSPFSIILINLIKLPRFDKNLAHSWHIFLGIF